MTSKKLNNMNLMEQKTWAQEVDEVYPVAEEELVYFPDISFEEWVKQVKKMKNDLVAYNELQINTANKGQVAVKSQVMNKNSASSGISPASTTEEMVFDGVSIEPKYREQAVGVNECVLQALEFIYSVKVVFSDANNRITIKGCSEEVKQCKEDIEFNMSVRRWWDEQPNDATCTAQISADLANTDEYSNSTINEATTSTTEEIVFDGVYIEPKYQEQAVGVNECVLQVLEDMYDVKVVFSEANSRITIKGK